MTPELDRVPPTVGDGIDRVNVGGDADVLWQWLGGTVPEISAVQGAPGVAEFALRRGEDRVVVGAR